MNDANTRLGESLPNRAGGCHSGNDRAHSLPPINPRYSYAKLARAAYHAVGLYPVVKCKVVMLLMDGSS